MSIIITSDSTRKLAELLMTVQIVIGEQYAGGYHYRCRNCGSLCFCEEWLHANGTFVPILVKCAFGCGTKWILF